MTDPQITIQGFESSQVRQQVKDLMEDLVQLCPSDAAVIASFRQLPDRILAEVKIASESVYMHVVDQTSGIGDCLDHVKSKLLTQIITWRKERFAS